MSKKRTVEIVTGMSAMSRSVLDHMLSYVGPSERARLRPVCWAWNQPPTSEEGRLRECMFREADARLAILLSRARRSFLVVGALDYDHRVTLQQTGTMTNTQLGATLRNGLIRNEQLSRAPDRVDFCADWFQRTMQLHNEDPESAARDTTNGLVFGAASEPYRCPCIIM